MKISIGCDHGGYELKEYIKENLINKGIEVEDVGTNSKESVDFPIYAKKVSQNVQSKKSDLGILCCGTGIGMSIAANKFKGIRAAVVSDCFSAQATREHNNTNILCLGERIIGKGLAMRIVEEWLNSSYNGERHARRLQMIDDIEKENL
ncbi:TPA: ribose 5-phosphate isomerase B [Clostridioides difficile]|nr:ribose 5-phosphate isomerase B [Clostridioides difficile]